MHFKLINAGLQIGWQVFGISISEKQDLVPFVIENCLLPIDNCSLPIAYCLLPIDN